MVENPKEEKERKRPLYKMKLTLLCMAVLAAPVPKIDTTDIVFGTAIGLLGTGLALRYSPSLMAKVSGITTKQLPEVGAGLEKVETTAVSAGAGAPVIAGKPSVASGLNAVEA